MADAGTATTLRTVVLCATLPEPVRGGNDLRNRALLGALATLGPVGAIGLCHPGPRVPPDLPVRWWSTVGDPTLDAARLNSPGTGWTAEPDGHPCHRWVTPQAVRGLREHLATIAPDVLVVSEVHLWPLAAAVRDLAGTVVLDVPSVASRVLGEIAGTETTAGGRLARRLLAERTRALERRAVSEVDEVWVCSPVDAGIVDGERPGTRVRIIPNVVDVPATAATTPDEPILVYPALFSFAPNRGAARRLVDGILPVVQASVAGARLALVGPGVDGDLAAAAAAASGVEVTGPVPDTGPWFDRAAVVPVPLTEGSGTRMKILEALARARPVVTTAKGREGLDLVEGSEVIEAESDIDIAAGIVELLQDPQRLAAFGAAGRRAVLDRYSPAVLAGCLREAMTDLGVPRSRARHRGATTVTSPAHRERAGSVEGDVG